jgi:hypothetical protein
MGEYVYQVEYIYKFPYMEIWEDRGCEQDIGSPIITMPKKDGT